MQWHTVVSLSTLVELIPLSLIGSMLMFSFLGDDKTPQVVVLLIS